MNVVDITVTGHDKSGPAFDSASRSGHSFGDTLGRIGTIAGGILASDLIGKAMDLAIDGFNKSIDAASNLNESMNAVQKVFGASQQKILDWGKNNATSFGLSQRAFNEMATPMGALLKNAGLNLDQVATSTIKLTERASDMASVFNTDVSDALEAIQAGLRGESDPLERYGVSLSAAKVEAEALTETHKKAASQLTQTELMTARLNLIMQQTASTAGDFKDTSDGLANSQRILAARTEEVQAQIGEKLLPIMARWSEFKLDVVSEISDKFVPALDGAISKAGEFKAAIDPQLTAALNNLKQGLGTNSEQLGRYKEDLDLVQSAMETLVGSSIALLIFNLEVLRGSIVLFDAAWNVFKTAAKIATLAVVDYLDAIATAAAFAFGWVPGLGGKLKDAAAHVHAFREYVNNELSGIKDKYVSVIITEEYRTKSPYAPGGSVYNQQVPHGAMAHGGIVGAQGGGPRAGRTVVGERGWEILDLAPGTTVHSHEDSVRMMSEMGGGNIDGTLVTEVKFTGNTDDIFASALQKLLRTGAIVIQSKYIQN